MTLACLSSCTWFGSRKPPPAPSPTEIIVTGAPVGSIVLIDGVPIGQPTANNARSHTLDVAAGAHKVEISVGERVVYREDTYVAIGERTVVIVKSGSGS